MDPAQSYNLPLIEARYDLRLTGIRARKDRPETCPQESDAAGPPAQAVPLPATAGQS